MNEFAKWRRRHCKHVRLEVQSVIPSKIPPLFKFNLIRIKVFEVLNLLCVFLNYFPLINISIVCIETMAPHGKELTTEQKEIIISLSNNGYSSYKIQEMTNINSRTVQKFLKRVRERGSIENRQRSGGKKKTTARDDRVLFRRVKGNRRT